jgi:hypothetical protein
LVFGIVNFGGLFGELEGMFVAYFA